MTVLWVIAALAVQPAPPQTRRAGATATAWFGLQLPQPSDAAPAVRVGPRPPRSADSMAGPLDGAVIKRDVDTIVGFAREARAGKEIGSGQMWGRIAGFPSSDNAVDWSLEQFRRAGITDVRRQSIDQDPKSSLWLPLSWQVTLLGDPAFGSGTE